MREGAPGPRVLCVDDEPELLKGLKLQLRKVARVELAERASAALSALDEDGPFDVVVSDMRMPEMDGAQFLSEVRTRWPMTERILLTGQADVESTAAAVNQGGIVRMLTKPCPKEVLVDAVLSAAETARLRRVEHELLEGTLRGALGILGQILGLVSPLPCSAPLASSPSSASSQRRSSSKSPGATRSPRRSRRSDASPSRSTSSTGSRSARISTRPSATPSSAIPGSPSIWSRASRASRTSRR